MSCLRDENGIKFWGVEERNFEKFDVNFDVSCK